MASGGIESLNSIEFSCYSASVGNTIHGQLKDQNGNTICEFVIEVELPVFNVSFENSSVNPNSDIETVLSVSNFSGGIYQNIWIEVSALSEGADVTMYSTSDSFSTRAKPVMLLVMVLLGIRLLGVRLCRAFKFLG